MIPEMGREAFSEKAQNPKMECSVGATARRSVLLDHRTHGEDCKGMKGAGSEGLRAGKRRIWVGAV